jgi:hypothetical protein
MNYISPEKANAGSQVALADIDKRYRIISGCRDTAFSALRAHSFVRFLEKLPETRRIQFLKHSIIYNSPQRQSACESLNAACLSEKRDLLIIGDTSDLDLDGMVGLWSHLYGLVQLGFHGIDHMSAVIRLSNDHAADKLCRGLGYQIEIRQFRRARPYGLQHESSTLCTSVLPCSSFNESLFRFVNDVGHHSVSQRSLRIVYTDRFSVACDLDAVRGNDIEGLVIVSHLDGCPSEEVCQRVHATIGKV